MKKIITIALIVLMFSRTLFAQENKTEEKNYESVVTISTYDKNDNLITQGSGFIATKDGAIVTNLHLLNKAVTVKVKTTNDKFLEIAGVLYCDKVNDLAILKAKDTDLSAVSLANSDKIKFAGKVYIINKAKAPKNSAIKGMLSGYAEFIQNQKVFLITGIVSSGNGGEPVFDENGCVIGVATFFLNTKDKKMILAMPVNLIKNKLSETAVTPLQEALAGNYYSSPEYLLWLGYCSYTSGDTNKAINYFKEAIRVKPDFAEGHRGLGFIYTKLQDYTKAINSFNEAIRINPGYALAISGLGFVYATLDDYEKAVELYKESVRLNPKSAETYFNLGNNYLKMKDYMNAMRAWQEAVRIHPDFVEAYEAIGKLYSAAKEREKAIESYQEAVRIRPDYAEMYLAIGTEYTMLLDDQKSMEAFKKAVQLKPDYAEAHFCLGTSYLLVKDVASAKKEYEILKKLNPKAASQLLELIRQREDMMKKNK